MWTRDHRIFRGKERDEAKTHGHISGVPVGTRFKSRVECARARVHAPLRAGIHGNRTDGAYSIVMSYGYEDDEDHGDMFIYSGQGGRDTSGDKMDQMLGKEHWDGKRVADQDWTKGNKALKISSITKKPVRVIRGQARKLQAKYAPAEGYRYDGLYEVKKAWFEDGKSGFKTCRFLFIRLPNQPPLPGFKSGSATSKAGLDNSALCRAVSTLSLKDELPQAAVNQRKRPLSNPSPPRPIVSEASEPNSDEVDQPPPPPPPPKRVRPSLKPQPTPAIRQDPLDARKVTLAAQALAQANKPQPKSVDEIIQKNVYKNMKFIKKKN